MKLVSYLVVAPTLVLFIYLLAGIPYFSPNVIKKAYFQDPNLTGPSTACLNGAFVYATFAGAGDPSTDRYIWTINDSEGFELYYQSGGAEVQQIEFPFTSVGVFTVTLRVIRDNNQNFYSSSQQVVVERGPQFVLAPDVVLCGSDPVMLQALDTDDPNFGNYSFEWFGPSGEIVGTENTYLATEPGMYTVRVVSPACEAVGSTFLGPSIQVDVTASAVLACLGQTVSYTPDSPIMGIWSYQKDGESSRTVLGDSYTLDLNTSDLDGIGQYTVYFNVDDPERPGCSVEKSFDLDVQEGAGDFTLNRVSDSNGCESADGAFEIQTSEPFDSIIISSISDGTFDNVPANTTYLIQNLEPRVYTVTGRRGNCSVTRTIGIENTDFDEAIPFTVDATPQTCSPTGVNLGSLIVDFGGVSQSGEYRAVRSDGEVYSGSFQNETQLTIDVQAGSYEVEISSNQNCNSTNAEVQDVSGSNQVSFSIPGDITACEFYELTPESDQELSYTLRRPDGTEVTGLSGDEFILDQDGTYTLIGTSTDPDSPLCPRTQTFDVTVNEPLEFDVIIQQIDCFGNQLITADLFGRDPNSVVIRWYTEDRTIVGRQPVFFPPSTGRFLLEVQPRASSPCEVVPVTFDVVIPDAETEVELSGEPLCGDDPFTTLTMSAADPDLIEKIEWFRIDEQGERIWLFDYDGQASIDATEEGEYEVIVRNQISCRLGSANFIVERVASQPIAVEDEYEICSEEGIYPVLNPGDFQTLEWYLDGQLVSEDPSYRLTVAGEYEVMVSSEEGCVQSKSFSVVDACVVMVRFTNAMIPGNPTRDFRVYANTEIDEVEVFIYQRTGELIFHAGGTVSDSNIPVCVWDGLLHGKPISTDIYPVVIKYKSSSLGLDQVLKKSLFVVR